MINATPQDVCSAAWHEGGHAVVGRRVFGLPIEQTTITADGGGMTRFNALYYRHSEPRVKSLIALAGPAAEHLATGAGTLAPLPPPGSGDDLNLRAAKFDRLTTEEQHDLRLHARRLVQDHRRDIDVVARALMHMPLDGATIDALLNAKEGAHMRYLIDDDDPRFETLPDGRKILRDGARFRVPLTMRDSVSDQRARITDGAGSTAGLHRPGFRLGMADGSDERAKAYAERDLVDAEAWRYDADGMLSEGKEVGAACTVRNHKYRKYFGEPGHLVEEDGDLVCRPDSLDKRARHDAMTLDQIQLDHQRRMRAEYEAYDRELQQRYKTL